MSASRSPTPGVQTITRKVIRTLEGLGEHTVDEDSSNPSSDDDEPLEKREKDREKTDWEIPRKVLHSSIGFGTVYLYVSGGSPAPVTRALWTALLCVILPADILRLTLPRSPFAGLYNTLLGPLMRPSELTQANGVIYYILGVNTVLTLLPLDVAVVAILILSWADTAASTFGRLYGRATPRLPWSRRKSLAGFAAAAATGTAIVLGFWGGLGGESWVPAEKGWGATALFGAYAGLVSALAESLDFGLDDNLTLPVIAGGCLHAFIALYNYVT
ncbi:hypothetical protein IW261DRAFT_1459916 [Armillaria novae-zelandiae]|uniref:CTP-dependent diacylglycerol kinase 1 n=1 Tax=Armillaria novae-zelandiae TaxID=153914 RepID=A0AA39TF30_9AGAR|nr:hypothetical protein IW261DRAFT_1459916 [Armillaria novae-zelandiae]